MEEAVIIGDVFTLVTSCCVLENAKVEGSDRAG